MSSKCQNINLYFKTMIIEIAQFKLVAGVSNFELRNSLSPHFHTTIVKGTVGALYYEHKYKCLQRYSNKSDISLQQTKN